MWPTAYILSSEKMIVGDIWKPNAADTDVEQLIRGVSWPFESSVSSMERRPNIRRRPEAFSAVQCAVYLLMDENP